MRASGRMTPHRLERSRPVIVIATAVVCSVAVWAWAGVFTVTTTDDSGPGSLRDAIAQANAQAGADEIVFDPALSGSTISLTSGQLTISDELAITGLGEGDLTIARDGASPNFRVFEIDDGQGTNIDVVISGVTISGGRVESKTANVRARGGGVLVRERLILRDSTISGNSAYAESSQAVAEGGGVHSSSYLLLVNSTIATNDATASVINTWAYESARASGGGIFSTGPLGVDRSTIQANSAGASAKGSIRSSGSGTGGGIKCSDATVRNSTISGNNAGGGGFDGAGGSGGGISATNLVIEYSTVSNNRASSNEADNFLSGSSGGGISSGALQMYHCAVSGNRATDPWFARGGGVRTETSTVIENSTISGNFTSGELCRGGGLSTSWATVIRSSTITFNTAAPGVWWEESYGGGAHFGSADNTLESTIVFGNTADFGLDIHCQTPDCSFNVAAFNLIGDPTDSSIPIGSSGNITGDPQLGPLQDNGGPTATRAIGGGSIALDAGSNPADLSTDQRGYRPREFGGVADIGAYEHGAVELIFAAGFEFGYTAAWTWVNDVHTVTLPGGVVLRMARVPGGTFWIGAKGAERGARSDEYPRHQASLTRDFYIGTFEVTQAQWQAIMGSNPAHDHGVGDDHPVYYVSWADVASPGGFIELLNQHLTNTGQAGAGLYRLPTEAEWEHAARAGTTTRYSFGDALECSDHCQPCDIMNIHMWWCGNATETRPVGSKNANGFGLSDMHGNVAEWVADWYGGYPVWHQLDPTGPASGSFRVVRGGDWSEAALRARSANRRAHAVTYSSSGVGFRVARDAN